MLDPRLAELRAEYIRLRPIAVRLCDTLVQELPTLTANQGVTLAVPMEGRVKEWSSIERKLEWELDLPSSPQELNDFVGVRLILLFGRDVPKAERLVRETFDVVHEEDLSKRLDETEFGYQSTHFDIKLPEGWLGVPTKKDLGSLVAEIQIRTIAQHMWAAASHKLQYKQEEAVPPPIKRSIHRVSALLEIVDLEFERVLEERERYRSDTDRRSPDDVLNVDLLAEVLRRLLPSENADHNEDGWSQLLPQLGAFGITTTSQLESLIGKHLEALRVRDAEMVDNYKLARADSLVQPSNALLVENDERAKAGVYYTHVGLARQALRIEFGEEQFLASFDENQHPKLDKWKDT